MAPIMDAAMPATGIVRKNGNSRFGGQERSRVGATPKKAPCPREDLPRISGQDTEANGDNGINADHIHEMRDRVV